MIVVLKKNIQTLQRENIRAFLVGKGYTVKEIVGQEETVFGAVGKTGLDVREVEMLEGVAKVIPISKPYKLASRELQKEDTIVKVGKVKIGGNRIAVMAGPCAVESRNQILSIAAKVREAGAVILRGGAFKPRTSPYSFQGLKEEGLNYLKEAGERYGMPVTTEIVNPADVDMMRGYIDMFQVGARNMQNFELLKAVGRTGMPVLLKRGLCATIEEWLMAAEYLMASGTDQVVLCERGIRTFERATRNTLDCSAIPVVQKLTHLPVIGDPSHATGLRDMVAPMSLALVASGASGLIVEVHDHPEKALSDGPQSLYPLQFEKLMRDIQALSPVVGKSLEKIPRQLPASMEAEDTTASAGDHTAIAFQGERGAFSELAVRRAFDEQVDVLPCKRFSDVFEAVMDGRVQYGVVPVENTLGGTIHEVLDLLDRHPGIRVIGEQQIRIIHDLIGLPGATMGDITHIYSHPQGLAQCADFLAREMNHAEAVPFFDTAGAVSFIKKKNDPTKAAIAGAPAAKVNGMQILREGIESNPSNYTRFYVISREETAASFRPATPIDRASLEFSVKDRPGSLFEALEVLSRYGLNMKKLESRPIAGKPWEYSFFVETELKGDDGFAAALEELKRCCSSIRVLGTFPAGL